VYSNKLLTPDPTGQMFEAHSESWRQARLKILEFANVNEFVLQIDVSHYFERIPQHYLIEMLKANNQIHNGFVNLLETMLSAFRQRASFGIIQGVLPSDLLGNFYLSSFDAQCKIDNVEEVRFVDDIYIPYGNHQLARRGLTRVADILRNDGLNINETKSGVRYGDTFRRDLLEADELFAAASEELKQSALAEIDFGYGFLFDDSEEVLDEEALENIQVDAVLQLFEAGRDRPDMIAKIDRFCFPVLTVVASDVGVARAIEGIRQRPYLAQVYAFYLGRLVRANREAFDGLRELAMDRELGDYELMLVLAALNDSEDIDAKGCVDLLRILADQSRPEPVRAIAAMVAAKFGRPAQRRAVRVRYENESSPYMRAAILYASQFFEPEARKACKRAWAGHGEINRFVASAI